MRLARRDDALGAIGIAGAGARSSLSAIDAISEPLPNPIPDDQQEHSITKSTEQWSISPVIHH